MRVIDNYRRYLERKAEQNVFLASRSIELRGQALLWAIPAVILGGIDYKIKISEPYRTILFLAAGILFVVGFLFAAYVLLFADAKIDDERTVSDGRDHSI